MWKKVASLLSIFVLPTLASAHVKWFVDSEKVLTETPSVPFYGVTSTEVLVWAGITLLVVLVFGVLDSYIKTSKKLLAFGFKHEVGITRIAQVILGLFLVSVSFLWNVVLIPELKVISTTFVVLKYIQVAIGVLFITNILPRLASAILFAMCIMLGFTYEWMAVLENALLISLSVFFFIKNSPKDSWVSCMFDKHAVEIVRLGTGITLITLAFTEKLIYPQLSAEFLQAHPWNFMAGIFPWFTNKLFILSTGFAELIFGIVFILGYLTRINTVLIACFFAASVVTMFVQYGAWEVEDLVVYSAALLFIFYGHGKTKFFHHVLPNSWMHKRLVGKK